MTIRGNGAVLLRAESAEPFRFFEVWANSRLSLENITLQGGDVGEDWGGAIHAMSALLELEVGCATVADGNYWGDPSGPSGMGPGTGDSVGKRLTFEPFLTEAPAHCDPVLSVIK